MRYSALLVLALGGATYAVPTTSRSTYAVKGSHPVPRDWTQLSRASSDHKLELRIGLVQDKFADLESHLLAASDPTHEKYGQHLSLAEVHEFTKPSQESSDAVHQWLEENGIPVDTVGYTSAAKDWIKVTLPVSQVEELLDTTYHTYIGNDGRTAVRTPEWSLPIHLHKHIATIQPTNSFFGPRAQARMEKRRIEAIYDMQEAASALDLPPPSSAATVDAVCNTTWVTPLCLRTLYGTVNYTVQSADKNTMALNDFLGEVNSRSDTGLYLQRFRPEAYGAQNTFKKISINGGTINDELNSTELAAETGIEGNLDDQTMLGVAWPTPLTVYATGGSAPYNPDIATSTDTNEPYLAWLEYILSLPDPLPSVISTSYDDDEQSVPKDYAIQVCASLAQLGARGVSVFFAAGDEGVGTSGTCFTNDGKNSSTFLAQFPSSCPWVTSVGGTFKFNPEVPVFRNRTSGLYTGGGGFSNYFDTPRYQKAAVNNYLTKYVKDEYKGLYNPQGRGYPDVSGQSLNYTVYWNHTLLPVSGTSASTPAISAIFALVNDALVAAGRPTLGFLNPLIYSGGYKAFNDITTGSNYGCDTAGFPAVQGWDAATGYGTPNFQDILAYLGINGKEWISYKE